MGGQDAGACARAFSGRALLTPPPPPSHAPCLQVGDHIAYRYEVLDVLGRGSFGQVLRCVDHAQGAGHQASYGAREGGASRP